VLVGIIGEETVHRVFFVLVGTMDVVGEIKKTLLRKVHYVHVHKRVPLR
jgi:hypothetical protein